MISRDSIVKRKSIRTYSNEQIDSFTLDSLQSYIDEVSTPFETEIRFKIMESRSNEFGQRLGTYGLIKGANTFICGAVKNQKRSEEDLGLAMEKVVLHAVSLGLGTCWLAGSFNKANFGKAVELKEDEILPIVISIGYPDENRSFFDKVMYILTRSKNRKDWNEIFFDRDFDKPLCKEEVGIYTDALEMVRIAPSGFNKQPWRVVKSDDTFHFYMEGKKKEGQFSIDRLCIGIAMCHFELMLNELGVFGKWMDLNPNIVNENKEYVISFSI